MKTKIDLYKFVRSLVERYYDKIHIDPTTTKCWLDSVLEDQGLEYKDGEIVEISQETGDEKIKKAILSGINFLKFQGRETFGGIPIHDCITWLEKQAPKNKTAIDKAIEEEVDAWLKKQGQSMTITIPKDLKGTDTDGGVVGERGEEGEPETLKEKVEHWQRMHDIAMEKIKGEFKEEDSLETKAIKEHMENLKKRIEDNQLGCIVQRLDKIIELLQSAILILPKEPYVPPIIYKRPLDPDPNVLGGWTTTASSDYDIDTNKIKQNETSKPES